MSGGLAGLLSAGLALSGVPSPTPNLFNNNLALLFVIIVAAAIILIGPGAFSLDARLFGRREIIICNPIETDDALTFCRFDGTPLVWVNRSASDSAKVLESGSPSVEDEKETVALLPDAPVATASLTDDAQNQPAA